MKRVAAVVFLAGALFAQSAPKFNGQTWWNYVKVLAADDMEGRETGSAGERKAQAYVVALERLDLRTMFELVRPLLRDCCRFPRCCRYLGVLQFCPLERWEIE